MALPNIEVILNHSYIMKSEIFLLYILDNGENDITHAINKVLAKTSKVMLPCAVGALAMYFNCD